MYTRLIIFHYDVIQVKSVHFLEFLLCFFNENSLLCRMLAPGID